MPEERIETYGLSGPRDLLKKLKRDAALLAEEVTSDRFFNFVVTAYSILDWVKTDPVSPPAASGALSGMYDDKWIRVCRDLANASKHFVLRWDERKPDRGPVTSGASSKQGYGIGRYGVAAYGVGEESIQITLNDGSSFSSPEFVEGVVDAWDSFFLSQGL